MKKKYKNRIKVSFFPIVVTLIYFWVLITSIDSPGFDLSLLYSLYLFIALVVSSLIGLEIGENKR